jgi:hypothetical protein
VKDAQPDCDRFGDAIYQSTDGDRQAAASLICFACLLVTGSLAMFGAPNGQELIGDGVDRGPSKKPVAVAVRPVCSNASAISSNDKADISTPLPKAITPAITLVGTLI